MCLLQVTSIKNFTRTTERDAERGELSMPPPAYTQARARAPVYNPGIESSSPPMHTIGPVAALGPDLLFGTRRRCCGRNPTCSIVSRRR